MVDIATVSVVSSAGVAALTVAANFLGGERQRRDEADLDFEKRVWEEKSKALFTVITECRGILDSDEELTDDTRQSWALYLSRRLDTFTDAQATVEAFASTRCRVLLTELIETLRSLGVNEYLGRRVDHYRDQMHKVPMSDVYETQAAMAEVNKRNRYRELIKEAEQEAVADFNPDLAQVRARAQRLLEAARESVRSPRD